MSRKVLEKTEQQRKTKKEETISKFCGKYKGFLTRSETFLEEKKEQTEQW